LEVVEEVDLMAVVLVVTRAVSEVLQFKVPMEAQHMLVVHVAVPAVVESIQEKRPLHVV